MSVKLPEKFAEKMKQMLSDEDYSRYLESLEKPAKSGVRVNTLKLSGDEFRKISDFSLSPVPWIDNAFLYENSDLPSKHPFYYAGLYYIQEPSAMTPAFLFDVKPGDRVLDLCAAPGGKSTALGAKLCGEGVLVSNDVSNSRAKALLKNLELFGIKNAVTVSETPEKLSEHFESYFNRILVDAPCSGEGMFRKQSQIMLNWEQYGSEYYAKLQRKILPEAVKMLAPGGKLLYSTCTFSPLEDEEAVVWLLKNNPELRLVPAFDESDKEKYISLGFDHGREEWLCDEAKDDLKTIRENAGYPACNLSDCIRLFPHKLDGEGHFIAVFEKLSENENGNLTLCSADGDNNYYELSSAPVNRKAEAKPSDNDKRKKGKGYGPGRNSIKAAENENLPDALSEFLTHLKPEFENERIRIRDGWCYYVPKGLPDLKGLRLMREGLLLGEIKKDRFEPSQALAMSLNINDFDNVYDMETDNPDVIRYLKCESISVPESIKDGTVLVCAGGFPLGFGKLKNGNFKNKYLPGWRMM